MYNKTRLLDSVFVIYRIIKVSVRVITEPQPSASADHTYLDLVYSGYHKNLIQYLFKFTLKCYQNKYETESKINEKEGLF